MKPCACTFCMSESIISLALMRNACFSLYACYMYTPKNGLYILYPIILKFKNLINFSIFKKMTRQAPVLDPRMRGCKMCIVFLGCIDTHCCDHHRKILTFLISSLSSVTRIMWPPEAPYLYYQRITKILILNFIAWEDVVSFFFFFWHLL